MKTNPQNLLLPFFLLLTACSTEQHKSQRGYYYWKTDFALSQREQLYLESCSVQRLFVKFADIGRNQQTGEVEPFSLLTVSDTSGILQKEIIPCFFITNEVFQNSNSAQVMWLVGKIMESLESISQQFDKKPEDWQEIQIDCDWTASSREAYFLFLKQIRRKLPDVCFSATIRLHQFKNPRQTGVPPVERGTLMCYNTGEIEVEATENAILSYETAAPYLSAPLPTYPIPLDLAFPVFSWAPIYRDGELWRIIPDPAPNLFSDTSRFYCVNRRIAVKSPTFVGGHYLRTGDHIRQDTISPELLLSMSGLIRQVQTTADASLLFYHLDSMATVRFNPLIINYLCDTLTQQ